MPALQFNTKFLHPVCSPEPAKLKIPFDVSSQLTCLNSSWWGGNLVNLQSQEEGMVPEQQLSEGCQPLLPRQQPRTAHS